MPKIFGRFKKAPDTSPANTPQPPEQSHSQTQASEGGSGSGRRFSQTVIKLLPALALIAIIALGMGIRLAGSYGPDGDPRWPYLRNIDSYFFYRYIDETVQNNGVLPDYDPYRLAPDGTSDVRVFTLFYTYLGAYAFMSLGSLLGQTLIEFLIWFPALLAALTAIPVYFIASRIFKRKAGLLAALFMALAPGFMTRSLGSDPDSDAIVMLVLLTSLAIFWLGMTDLKKSTAWKRSLLYGIALGISLAVFTLTWAGVWLAFGLIGGFIVLKLVAEVVLRRGQKIKEFVKNEWIPILRLFAIAWVVYGVLLLPFLGLAGFLSPVAGGIRTVTIVKVESGAFPNVDVSIAEAQAGGSASDVVLRAAGLSTASAVSNMPTGLLLLLSPFLITLAAFIYLAYSFYKRREHLDAMLFIGMWFIGFVFASLIVVRATIFLAPIYAIGSGIIISKLWELVQRRDKEVAA